jgi:hypothetical protein
MYFWTGTSGGFITNPDDYVSDFPAVGPTHITTYPELLQKAGSAGRSIPTTRSGTAAVSMAGSVTMVTTRCGSTSSTRTRRTRPPRPGRNWPSAAPSSPGSPMPATARPEPRQPPAGRVRRRRHQAHPAAGLLDRGAVRVFRAPGGEPELRRPLCPDGARGADGQPGPVEHHRAVHYV